MRTPTTRTPESAVPARAASGRVVAARDGVEARASREPAVEEELIMNLERDQFVVETSRPVPRAALSRRATLALWGLRVFAIAVSLMVIYTFAEQLH
jgi:hypothetical protein